MDRPKRILAIDDERINLRVIGGLLRNLGHEPVLTESFAEARGLLDESIDLVLLDVMMPETDGFTVARSIRGMPGVSDVPIIMVTALTSKQDRLKAVEAGANDFISKPIDLTELRVRMGSLLKMKESQDEVKRYQAELEEMVAVRTSALKMALENVKESQRTILAAHLETIHRLAAAAEFKDEETADHIQRMSRYCALLAYKLGLPEAEVDLVLQASPMHDIGKIGIPDSILLKPAKLTPDEWEVMQKHTIYGARILGESNFELLRVGEIIAMSHHEKWDGSGYPRGLRGEDIPLYGRICAVADVFDALTSKRPYKEAFSNEKSLEIMRAGWGSHFDPGILDVFLQDFESVEAIQREFELDWNSDKKA
ncbi:HD domain-containing phosphohydrolase [Solidesulfovibrio sp.]|uniref:HD domain-containing phosphohydrolase n=1 Tax=Solidesulfovibrio sp. TaxID=2910990 RepID=UPI00260B42B4|nr:HD domain-containing phosphohydrolase [Solidesulfovibrio sp.]